MKNDQLKEINQKLDNLSREIWALRNPPKYRVGESVSAILKYVHSGRFKKGIIAEIYNAYGEKRGWLYRFEGEGEMSAHWEGDLFTADDLKNV